MERSEWTFLTNHGHVLAFIAKNPVSTTQKLAHEVGITQRAIQKIIADLERDGYLARCRVGRCNRYTVHPALPMRHPLECQFMLSDLLGALGCQLQQMISEK